MKKLSVKIGIVVGLIAVLGFAWKVGTWLDCRWTHAHDFDLFAQSSQQMMQKTNEALEKTNKRIEFQSLKDELKYTQQRIEKIKDDYKGKPMPQSVKEMLADLRFREQELVKTLDAFYQKK